MTLDEIIEVALIQLQRDTDDQSVDEFAPGLKDYINEGYAALSLSYRPQKSKLIEIKGNSFNIEQLMQQHYFDGSLELDDNGNPKKDQTIRDIFAVVGVFNEELRPLPYRGISTGEFYVAAPKAKVQFSYLPPVLVDGKEEPVLPQWSHYALVNFGTYKALLEGAPSRQARGDRFYRDYETVRLKLADGRGEKHFRNEVF